MISDLEYLKNHCDRMKSIKTKITGLLDYSKILDKSKPIEGCKLLRIIHYKNLGDTWIVGGNSKALNTLVIKLIYMFDKGDIINIYPLLNRIVNVGIKKQTRPAYDGKKAMFLGHGHFRLSETMFVLTPDEIKIIKEYFEL